METLGTNLTDHDKRQVLGTYCHRFTVFNVPNWAKSGNYINYPHFKDDRDWLSHTYFETKTDGTLDKRFNHCRSNPTWPLGKGINGQKGKDW